MLHPRLILYDRVCRRRLATYDSVCPCRVRVMTVCVRVVSWPPMTVCVRVVLQFMTCVSVSFPVVSDSVCPCNFIDKGRAFTSTSWLLARVKTPAAAADVGGEYGETFVRARN
jgi:hypothetical protein